MAPPPLAIAAFASLLVLTLTVGLEKDGVAAHEFPIRKVVLLVLENKGAAEVFGNRAASTFTELAKRYAVLPNYDAVDHPSLPNYLALISGSTDGIESDCKRCMIKARTLVDELQSSGKSWKAYFENLPSTGYTGARSYRYTEAVNPFIHFRDIVSSASRLRHLVPLRQLEIDLRRGKLPDFSFVAPNLCHDMHSCSVDTGDDWLARFLPPLLANRQLERGVVFVVFDEARRADSAGGGGHVPALVLGELVRPGSSSVRRLDHYSVLRTIEDAWHLRLLGQSAYAAPIAGIWRGGDGPGRSRTSAHGFEVRRSIH